MDNQDELLAKDKEFLLEMKRRLERGRDGDPTQFEFLENMIDDWIHELSSTRHSTSDEKRLEEDAKRYRLLRLHTAPARLAESLGVECEDLEPDELLEERVDKLVDAALSHKEEAE